MKPMEVVKKHPVAIGVGAFVVVVGAILFFGGSGGGASTSGGGVSDASVAAGMQMQQMQMAGQLEAQNVAAQERVAMETLAVQREISIMDMQRSGEADALAASIAMAQINAAQQTTALTSSLTYNLESARIASADTQQAAMLATIVEQSRLQAQTSTAAINAQVQMAKINKPKRGLFSMIFG